MTDSHSQLTFARFQDLAQPGRAIPVYRKLNADFLTPVIAYLKIRKENRHSFLLESVEKGEQLGRYSFIGRSPRRELIAHVPGVILREQSQQHVQPGTFFSVLQAELERFQAVTLNELPCFTGGAVGFIGYDMIRQIEDLPSPKGDPLHTPDAHMAFYDDLIAFDHLRNEVILIANVFVEPETVVAEAYAGANARLEELVADLRRPLRYSPEFAAATDTLQSNTPPDHFLRAVRRAKEYIFAGDIFQVVLSQRFSVAYEGDVFQVYRALRNINPSPYMFFLDFGEIRVVGSSPEPLIRAQNGELEIIPIAGTRPRGITPEEDRALEQDLLADPKELAEHVMLVDLARNDMGRVARYGSVQVSDFKTIERYSHVMHIISKVRGTLRPGVNSIDALQAAFPAGTVSGAPKIRAMEIIHELEPEKRGIYAGAVGYLDYSGNMDMCIAIRTLVATKTHLYFQAGAGIVADSVPQKEFEETANKARALRKAIEMASEGIHDFIYR